MYLQLQEVCTTQSALAASKDTMIDELMGQLEASKAQEEAATEAVAKMSARQSQLQALATQLQAQVAAAEVSSKQVSKAWHQEAAAWPLVYNSFSSKPSRVCRYNAWDT